MQHHFSIFEFLFIYLICIFIITTASINVVYLESEDNNNLEAEKEFLMVVSYMAIAIVGILFIVFLIFGGLSFRAFFNNPLSSFSLKDVFGIETLSGAGILWVLVAMLVTYSAVTIVYVEKKREEETSCAHSDQYLFIVSCITLGFSSLFLLPFSGILVKDFVETVKKGTITHGTRGITYYQ